MPLNQRITAAIVVSSMLVVGTGCVLEPKQDAETAPKILNRKKLPTLKQLRSQFVYRTTGIGAWFTNVGLGGIGFAVILANSPKIWEPVRITDDGDQMAVYGIADLITKPEFKIKFPNREDTVFYKHRTGKKEVGELFTQLDPLSKSLTINTQTGTKITDYTAIDQRLIRLSMGSADGPVETALCDAKMFDSVSLQLSYCKVEGINSDELGDTVRYVFAHLLNKDGKVISSDQNEEIVGFVLYVEDDLSEKDTTGIRHGRLMLATDDTGKPVFEYHRAPGVQFLNNVVIKGLAGFGFAAALQTLLLLPIGSVLEKQDD